ncbi:hypothetical protein, partial [Bacteroides caecimuris]|uniref:hypothetical protein n=1 Tax=Bacteroides caecimuris TaxID=1796613 RepID=UPI0025B79C31
SKPVYGCNVLMTANQQDEFQKVVPIYNLPTVFSDKMYFWTFYINACNHTDNQSYSHIAAYE